VFRAGAHQCGQCGIEAVARSDLKIIDSVNRMEIKELVAENAKGGSSRRDPIAIG
jgi:hypothetical protein